LDLGEDLELGAIAAAAVFASAVLLVKLELGFDQLGAIAAMAELAGVRPGGLVPASGGSVSVAGRSSAAPQLPVRSWIAQAVPPRDQFETCTLTIEQWLANEEEDGFLLKGKAAKWSAIMEACALVLPGIRRQDGLRQEPRVGFDPISDQPYFVFKASNNGTTFFVSPSGLSFDEDELIGGLVPMTANQSQT